ncbi:MAG TPA: segregation/condensation protein A [Candidatus Nanoarchaeia archaeon]|nr:segregation/condensation protein A [Candidatus Nanoarchaeia archaeon]
MEKEDINLHKKIQQEQIHDILFNREIGWKDIIYDLINTEQLDPWDINIVLLTDKFLEKIRQIEETNFFISSKVLLAAALLLRIKSEILLNKYVKSIDEILFGKKEIGAKVVFERIEFNEEIPELIPRSPMPRFKKVTLNELIESLNKAIVTENRRIKKIIIDKNALRMSSYSMPKRNFSIKDKIKEIYDKLFEQLKNEEKIKKITFTQLIGESKEERAVSFYPLLHLENQKKIWLEQEGHFKEIDIWLKETYLKHNPDPFADLKKEMEEEIEDLEELAKMKDMIDEEFVIEEEDKEENQK